MPSNSLTVQQVAAPDFSGIAQGLAAGGASFNNAFDAAHSVLDRYNSGMQAKADAGILNDLGQITNEADLTKFLTANPLAGRNLSPEMQKTILDMRKTVLGYGIDRANIDNTNASTANTRATTGINLATEGRNAADWQDKTSALAAYRGMTPALAAAYTNGQQYGQADNGGGNPNIVYENQGATRNDPLSPQLTSAMGFLKDMGVTMKVFSGGQENNTTNGTGSTRHNGGNAADAEFYIGDHKLDWNDPKDIPALQSIVERAHANGVTGFGAGNDYMGAGRMHVGFGTPGVWGANGKGANAPDWLVAAFNNSNGRPDSGGATPTPNGFTGGANNAYIANPAMQSAVAAMVNNPYMTPDAFKIQFDNLTAAQKTGQDAINERDAKTQALLAAQAENQIALNPTMNTDAARAVAALTTTGANPITQQQIAGDVAAKTAAGGIYNPIVNPPMITDPATELAATNAQQRADLTAQTDPSQPLLRVLEPYAKSDDPVKKLVTDFNDNKSWAISGVEVNRRTRDLVQKMADEAGVGVPEMAATLADMTDREALGSSLFSPKPTLGGIFAHYQDGKNANGWDSPDRDPIREAARRYGPGAKLEQTAAQEGAARTKASIEGQTTQIKALETQIARTALINPNDPQLPQLKAQHDALVQGLNQVGTKADTIAQKLKVLPQGSADAKKLGADLVAAMIAAGPSVYPASMVAQAKAMYGVP